MHLVRCLVILCCDFGKFKDISGFFKTFLKTLVSSTDLSVIKITVITVPCCLIRLMQLAMYGMTVPTNCYCKLQDTYFTVDIWPQLGHNWRYSVACSCQSCAKAIS